MHLAKCTLECNKGDCGYKLSEGTEMNFKYFCKKQNKYFKDFSGIFKIVVDNKTEEEYNKIIGENK